MEIGVVTRIQFIKPFDDSLLQISYSLLFFIKLAGFIFVLWSIVLSFLSFPKDFSSRLTIHLRWDFGIGRSVHTVIRVTNYSLLLLFPHLWFILSSPTAFHVLAGNAWIGWKLKVHITRFLKSVELLLIMNRVDSIL